MASQIQTKSTGERAVKLFVCFILALAVAAVPFAGIGTARADAGLEISTSYPGITIKAGNNADFTVKVANASGMNQNVALAVQSIPEGWEGNFTGGGNPITRVYVENGDYQNVSFSSTVPEDAAEGKYNIVLLATGENGITDTLELEINVSEKEITKGKFSSQFPSLQGSTSTELKFSTTIANNSGEDRAYSLTANAPEGWTVTFVPSYESQQIASLSVAAGSSQGLDVSIMPSASAAAGQYTITCTATSPEETLSVDLNVRIIGTYKLQLVSESGLLNADAYAGRETMVMLDVYNSGSADLANVKLSASAQSGWSVRFEPQSIDFLPAGEVEQVQAYIEASPDAIAGDYGITFSASSEDASSELTFRVAVKTSTVWGIVGIIIILILIAGLIVMFMKFGRR